MNGGKYAMEKPWENTEMNKISIFCLFVWNILSYLFLTQEKCTKTEKMRYQNGHCFVKMQINVLPLIFQTEHYFSDFLSLILHLHPRIYSKF